MLGGACFLRGRRPPDLAEPAKGAAPTAPQRLDGNRKTIELEGVRALGDQRAGDLVRFAPGSRGEQVGGRRASELGGVVSQAAQLAYQGRRALEDTGRFDTARFGHFGGRTALAHGEAEEVAILDRQLPQALRKPRHSPARHEGCDDGGERAQVGPLEHAERDEEYGHRRKGQCAAHGVGAAEDALPRHSAASAGPPTIWR